MVGTGPRHGSPSAVPGPSQDAPDLGLGPSRLCPLCALRGRGWRLRAVVAPVCRCAARRQAGGGGDFKGKAGLFVQRATQLHLFTGPIHTQACCVPTVVVATQSRMSHDREGMRTSASHPFSSGAQDCLSWGYFLCPLTTPLPTGASTDSLSLSWPLFSGFPRTPSHVPGCHLLSRDPPAAGPSLSYRCSARAWEQRAFETSNKRDGKPKQGSMVKDHRDLSQALCLDSHNAPEMDGSTSQLPRGGGTEPLCDKENAAVG